MSDTSTLKEYEALIVLKEYSEDFQKSIESTFTKRNSNIMSKENLGKKQLFHMAKKQMHGFFTYFKLQIPSESVNLLYQDFKIDTNILKCMITKI